MDDTTAEHLWNADEHLLRPTLVFLNRRKPSRLSLELDTFLARNRWPVRLARALGFRYTVDIVEHRIEVPAGAVPERGLRIGFASDFHAGAPTDPALLEQATEALRRARVDVLLLGGDYVSVLPSHVDALAPLLAAVPAPGGKFAVLGNHDHWLDPGYITRSLEAAGVRVLINRSARLPAPFEQVWICGLDDDLLGHPAIGPTLASADGIRVVLMHSPSGLRHLRRERFAVALCGHTHGGQIALPRGTPIVVPAGPLSRRYARGRYEVGEGRTLIVSVGVGCSGVPVRINAPPEVLVCTLSAAR